MTKFTFPEIRVRYKSAWQKVSSRSTASVDWRDGEEMDRDGKMRRKRFEKRLCRDKRLKFAFSDVRELRSSASGICSFSFIL